MARYLRLVICLLVVLVAPAVARAQTETVVYFHTDAIDSVRMITNANAQVLERHDYAPFGEPAPTNPPAPLRGFGGNDRDAETSFGYFHARYLAPGSGGRFTTVDPGHVGGDIFDSQSWNGYSYGRNNPLRFVDPEGMDYEIRIIGGETFIFEGSWADLHLFAPGFTFGSSTWSGDIRNAAGTKVGTYWWVPAENVFADAARGVVDDSVMARFGRMQDAEVLGASPFAPPLGRFVAAGRLFLKTSHYAPRLLAAGLNVAKVEAAVIKTVGNLRPAGEVRGRLIVDGVKIEWRAFVRPDGTVNIGSIFPVK